MSKLSTIYLNKLKSCNFKKGWMLMKKEYSIPMISIVMFDNEDIITSSGIDFDNLLNFTVGDGNDLLWEELFG